MKLLWKSPSRHTPAPVRVHRENFAWPVHLTSTSFGLWEETWAPGGNPHRHRDNVRTLHRQWPNPGIEARSNHSVTMPPTKLGNRCLNSFTRSQPAADVCRSPWTMYVFSVRGCSPWRSCFSTFSYTSILPHAPNDWLPTWRRRGRSEDLFLDLLLGLVKTVICRSAWGNLAVGLSSVVLSMLGWSWRGSVQCRLEHLIPSTTQGTECLRDTGNKVLV